MSGEKVIHGYDDIINLPHHQSNKRPHMSIYDRAAQFSPFAALTGYDDAVKEAARLTEHRKELSEEEKEQLNQKMVLLKQHIKEQPEVLITYYVDDTKKDGGMYLTESRIVKKIDEYEHAIIFENQIKIPVEHIIEIEGTVFASGDE